MTRLPPKVTLDYTRVLRDYGFSQLRNLKDNAALPATVRLLFEETLYDVDRNYRRWFEAPSSAGIVQWARERGARRPSAA